MKKLFLILLSVILFGCSENRVLLDELTNKGTDENRIIYYKSKLFNGVGFDIYPNSQLKEEGNHKDGKQDGLWKYYHKNGQLKEERNYINGIRDGLSKKWYKNGQLRYEWNYKDGKQEGLSKGWYRNSQLRYEWNYKDGKEHVASVGYSIGDFAQGGVIFWLDETKKHGLACPIEDQGFAAWLNTQDIVSDSMNHSFYGKRFRDWRVPTKSELNRMYKNKVNIDATAVLNGGSTFVNDYYWSSSESWEDDGTYFLGQWAQSFKDGYQDDDYYKWVKFNVRAVRNF